MGRRISDIVNRQDLSSTEVKKENKMIKKAYKDHTEERRGGGGGQMLLSGEEEDFLI